MAEEKLFGEGTTKCTIKDGVMTVYKIGYRDVDFEQACQALLTEPEDEVVADLSRLEYIASPEMGMLMGTHLRAEECGKKFKIYISEKLAKYFNLLNMPELVNVEVKKTAE